MQSSCVHTRVHTNVDGRLAEEKRQKMYKRHAHTHSHTCMHSCWDLYGCKHTLTLHRLSRFRALWTGKADDACFELISKMLGFVVWERMDLNDSHWSVMPHFGARYGFQLTLTARATSHHRLCAGVLNWEWVSEWMNDSTSAKFRQTELPLH